MASKVDAPGFISSAERLTY